MHRTYADVGNELSRGWGRDDSGDLSDHIKSIDNTERLMCLMASAVRELRDLNRMLGQPLQSPVKAEHPVADGMLRSLRVGSGDSEIPNRSEMLADGLSCRACKAIIRGGFKYLSELTRESLLDIRNVGNTTVTEIENWRDSLSRIKSHAISNESDSRPDGGLN